MGKRIVLIHGRSYKPDKTSLKNNWVEAIRHGIERDHGTAKATAFKKTRLEMAYYGDLSNQFLSISGKGSWTPSREAKDEADRKEALEGLKHYGSKDFTRKNYNKIKKFDDILMEAAADLLSGPLSIFGVGDELVGTVAPDMTHYWNPDAQFGSDVRWRLTEVLRRAINAEDQVLLIAHSLGTIVSYDVLWKFSHYGEYKALRDSKKLDISLVTLGSPLGDENVKDRLKGAAANGERKFPTNIREWNNFAAEDDYISHDSTVANDFSDIKKYGQKPKVRDHAIYNMSIRGGDPNPHHATGYLIHPKVVKLVADWL